jgi:Helix-turn-helix
LSRRGYEALLARAGDEDAEERMALLLAAEARAEEPLPDAVSSAILDGDCVLKALRIWRGLTQAELAKQAGINQGYLSVLENLSKYGSPETFSKLAGGLAVPGGWLC